jgi:hypothetical protein
MERDLVHDYDLPGVKLRHGFYNFAVRNTNEYNFRYWPVFLLLLIVIRNMEHRIEKGKKLIFLGMVLAVIWIQDLYPQIRESVEKDDDYVLSKYPYGKTEKFERIYCNKYPEQFDCKNIGSSGRGMFREDFTLADNFFVKLSLRPVGRENYNALNVAGLYLRNKRPGKNDTTLAYASLDIELEYLVNRIYFFSDELSSHHEGEIRFKLASLALVEENLFIISDRIYDNELSVCNNFKGIYYETSRRFFADVLYKLLEMEKNEEVKAEIRRILNRLPDKYKQGRPDRSRRY